MAAATFSDGQVPTAGQVNAIAAGAIEVFANAAARNAATPAPAVGAVCWLITPGALQAFDGTEWQTLASVREREWRVRYPLAVPRRAEWQPGVADTDGAVSARTAGVAGLLGAPHALPAPPHSTHFWSLTGSQVVAATQESVREITPDGSTQATAYELDYADAREVAHWQITDPNSVSTIEGAHYDTAGGISWLADGDWITVTLSGLSAWRIHTSARAQVVVVGSGGFGGNGGTLPTSHGLSAIAGGGGGAGGVASAVVDLVPGQLLVARCGGSVSTRTFTPEASATPLPLLPTDGARNTSAVFFQDGVSNDPSAGGTGCWIDGRPIAHAGGGSRGASSDLVGAEFGGPPEPAAWHLGGGSQGGSAALSSRKVSVWPRPEWLAAGRANSGGSGGTHSAPATTRLLASGGGGGGAAAAGADGAAIPYTNTIGTFAAGGSGGAGITLGWAGVPELGKGGNGGWAAGYPGAVITPDNNAANYGAGGNGAAHFVGTATDAGEELTHGIARHEPGLGCVLVRYRFDGGTFTETSLDR